MTVSSHPRQAIITGASSGIGRETALILAKAGINVALIGRSQQRLDAVVAAAEGVGVKAKAYPLDLSQLETIVPHIEKIIEDFGEIDILINNAGMGYTNLLQNTSLSDWQNVMDLNLTSIFQCVQGVLPTMRQRGQGMIVNVSSVATQNAFPEWGAYSISKVGLVTLSKILAAEERANGIRVTIITPGAVNTPIWDTQTVQADFDRSVMLTPDLVAKAILHAILLPAEAVIEEMTITPSAGTL
ncbi:MAG: SDR family oxidoreductase [Microcystaceae cyanobacterium]